MSRKHDRQVPITRSWFNPLPVSSFRQEMDNLLENFLGSTGLTQLVHANTPSLDVSETSRAVEVVTDVPGYQPDEIHVEVGEGRLTISGKLQAETAPDDPERKYHHAERRHGEFSRSITLPCSVKEDKVEAELKDGVLSIILPKADDTLRHKVTVKSVS